MTASEDGQPTESAELKTDGPADKHPYHLVVVGERKTRTLVCKTADELASALHEYRGNPEITELLVFQGRRIEASIFHITDVVLKAGGQEVGRGKMRAEQKWIESQ